MTVTGASEAAAARACYHAEAMEPTTGIAPGMTPANMIALPKDWAYDFLLFAQRNPRSCPPMDVNDSDSYTTTLVQGADLRTDLPLYHIWHNDELVDEITDAMAIRAQHPDPVTFLIGCRFTFE